MSAKNGNTRVLLKLVIVLVALAVAGGAVFFKLRDPVVVAPVTRGLAVDAVSGSVAVYAERGLRQLTSEAEGKVEFCDLLEAGQPFKKGDVLLQLDTTELDRQETQAKEAYETALKRVEIAYADKPDWIAARKKLDEAIQRQKPDAGPSDEIAQLQAALDAVAREINPRRILAKDALENAQRLYAGGQLAQVQLTAAEDNLKAIDTELRLADFDAANARRAHEVAMQNFRLQREKMRVIAPVDGVIDSTTMWKGALINRGTVVATFFSNDRVVVAKIGEEDFSKIKVGQQATVRLVIYTGQPPFDAKVSKILPTAEPETQRYTAFLDIADVAVDPVRLVPNSNGQVNITVGEHPNVLKIPRRAVFDWVGSEGRVWVMKEGRLELRRVSLGYISLNLVEVTKGLSLGEQVVLENVRGFHEGQFVQLAPVNP